ncbi:MAG: translocation/assembly module TamB domain-containing protein, partial [Kiloniellaceae bacterium]
LTDRIALNGARFAIEQATARSATTDAEVALVVDGSTLSDGRYTLALNDAAVLAGELGVATTGKVSASGTLAGPFDALELDGTMRLERLTIEEQALSDLSGTYRLTLKGADIDGPVSVALNSPFGPAEAAAELRLRSDALTLAGLQAELPQATVRGALSVPLDDRPITADLNGDIADLRPWLEIAGLSGGGKGTVTLQWNAPGAAAPVVAAANLSGVTLLLEADAAPVKADRLTVTLQAQDPALTEPGDIKVAAETLRWNRLTLKRLEATGKGTASALDVTLKADGEWIDPLALTAAGRISRQADTLTVVLSRAEGKLFGQPLALRDTATLTLDPAATRLDNLALASGDTTLTADALLGDGRIAVTAALNALPLTSVDAFWESELDGVVSAEVNLDGPFANPQGSARLNVSGLRPRDAKDTPELALDATAQWQDGRLSANGKLGGAKLAAATFQAAAPLQLPPDGSVSMPPDGPLTGRFDWSGDITTLLLFVPLPQHRLNGEAAIAVTVDGTVANPHAEGQIALENGRYENLETGTVLNALALTADVSDDKVTLANLSANDGNGGKVSGSGSMAIAPERHFPFDIAIGLEKFHAVRRDDVTAVTSGKVALDGDLDAPRIEGRFTTETVEISLATNLPPNVVSLDVVEMKDGVVQTPPPEEETAAPFDATLDIVIEMPRRVFVRGRGLDSEWAGSLSIQGPTTSPTVTGELNLVRGFMSVVGKPFDLTAGKVTLPEGADNEPALDVTAVHKGNELTVTARLSGPISQPELILSSVPQVPRDEIVSRVLFDKGAAQLTAAEAAQLAIALRDLTGQGGGVDILGFARRTLGVDVLRVETAEGGDAAVEAGKYLTDEVYLGVKQGASSQSSSAGVEVELTPNITVESEVTGSGAAKSGVRFHWDY